MALAMCTVSENLAYLGSQILNNFVTNKQMSYFKSHVTINKTGFRKTRYTFIINILISLKPENFNRLFCS